MIKQLFLVSCGASWAVCALCVLLLTPVLSFAVGEDREQSLTAIRERIADVTRHLEDIRGQQDELEAQLAEAEKNYGASIFALKNLIRQAVDKRREVEQTQKKIAVQKQMISRQSKGLAGVIRSAYALGQKDRLKMVLNQQDPALSSRLLTYYRYMNQSRLRKLKEISVSLSALQTLEQSSRQQSEHLNGLLELQEFEQAKLQGIKNERKALLVKLEEEYADNRQQLARLQESERQLRTLLGSLQEVSNDFPFDPPPKGLPFAQLRGQLAWPVRGALLKTFGSPRDEGIWDGVLIEAGEGVEIRAVTEGRVIYADWLRGYGLLMIIDHEQGYMTLYAFNQSLYKGVGDLVAAGEVIAAAGESGGRDQSGLYFGIRKDGKAVDPLLWCRK
ncbi:MAG: murein hydrolase activator EnvC family protein [Gammaproteobacteria bacterium]